MVDRLSQTNLIPNHNRFFVGCLMVLEPGAVKRIPSQDHTGGTCVLVVVSPGCHQMVLVVLRRGRICSYIVLLKLA